MTLQLGLFGKATIAETHVVSAHLRHRGDGSTVFVAEHLRWSRGSRAAPQRPRAAPAEAAPGQGSLFDPPG